MIQALMSTDTPRLILATARRSQDPRRHERRLLLAVVEQALADANELSRYGLAGPAIDAVRWLRSDSEEPFSFRWICRMLDTHPDAAQAQLRTTLVH